MKHRKAVVGAVGMCVGLFVAAPTASADPVNAKKGEILVVHCATLGDLLIATNGNGDTTPGLVLGSTQIGKPYAIESTFTFTPTGGDPITETESTSHPAPRNGRLDVCTFHIEGSDPSGSFVADGTAWITYTPAK